MPQSPFLQVILQADNFDIGQIDRLSHVLQSPVDKSGREGIRPWSIPLHMTRQDMEAQLPPIGWLRPSIRAFLEYSWPKTELGPSFIEFGICKSLQRDGAVGNCYQDGPEFAYFSDSVRAEGYEGLTSKMNGLAKYMREKGMYPDCLDGWRNEKYEIFASPYSSMFSNQTWAVSTSGAKNRVFDLERSACAVFGLATFGVHLTAYEGEGNEMKIWVPKRSATKATWPSKLDNSVAGGIPAGMTPFDSITKECEEEASLSEGLTKKYIKSAGFTTYFYVNEQGWFQPEFEYVYDLKLPSSDSPDHITLKPFDGEVDHFSLLPVSEILKIIRTDPTQFKPNCGLILVDFLMRHGFITPDNEPDYFEIGWRCHRNLNSVVAVVNRA